MEDVLTVLQCNGSRWYGNVLRKDDIEWVKKCIDFVVEGVKSLKLSKEDALVCRKWTRLIRDTEEDSDDSWVNVSCVRLFLVLVHPGYHVLKGRRMVVVVVVVRSL